jgi:four helix bundle protein
MKYKRFEDLPVWRDAIELAVRVFAFTIKPAFRPYPGVRDQIERASVSVSNNIAEGFGRFGNPEFIRFLNISQSSALEVQSMLYVLSDINYLNEEETKELRSKVDETRNLTLGLIRYLRGD